MDVSEGQGIDETVYETIKMNCSVSPPNDKYPMCKLCYEEEDFNSDVTAAA